MRGWKKIWGMSVSDKKIWDLIVWIQKKYEFVTDEGA